MTRCLQNQAGAPFRFGSLAGREVTAVLRFGRSYRSALRIGSDLYRHVQPPGLNLFSRRLLRRAASARTNRTEEQGISFGLVSTWPIVVRLRCGT